MHPHPLSINVEKDKDSKFVKCTCMYLYECMINHRNEGITSCLFRIYNEYSVRCEEVVESRIRVLSTSELNLGRDVKTRSEGVSFLVTDVLTDSVAEGSPVH